MEDLGEARSPRRPLSARMAPGGGSGSLAVPPAGRARPSTARPRMQLAREAAGMRITEADLRLRWPAEAWGGEAEERPSPTGPAARAHSEIMKVAQSSLATAHRARGGGSAAPPAPHATLLGDETRSHTDASQDTHTVLLPVHAPPACPCAWGPCAARGAAMPLGTHIAPRCWMPDC
jgi:hypothetical protein